jgi:hypothetical protein
MSRTTFELTATHHCQLEPFFHLSVGSASLQTAQGHVVNSYRMKLVSVSDTRSDDWFLMSSVWIPVSIMAFYLYFVLVFGPRMMRNRRPMQLDTVIKLYNITQVIVCVYTAERVSVVRCLNAYMSEHVSPSHLSVPLCVGATVIFALHSILVWCKAIKYEKCTTFSRTLL